MPLKGVPQRRKGTNDIFESSCLSGDLIEKNILEKYVVQLFPKMMLVSLSS